MDIRTPSSIYVRIEEFRNGWDQPSVNVREVRIAGGYELNGRGQRAAYHSAPLRELPVGASVRTSSNRYTRLE